MGNKDNVKLLTEQMLRDYLRDPICTPDGNPTPGVWVEGSTNRSINGFYERMNPKDLGIGRDYAGSSPWYRKDKCSIRYHSGTEGWLLHKGYDQYVAKGSTDE